MMKKVRNALVSIGLVFSLVCPPAYSRDMSADARADVLTAQWDALASDVAFRQKNSAYVGILMGLPMAVAGGILLGASPNSSIQTAGLYGGSLGLGLALGGMLSLLIENPYAKSAKDTFPGGLSGQGRLDAFEKKFQSLAEEEGSNRRLVAILTGVLGLGTTALFIPALDSSRDGGAAFLALLGPALVSASVYLYLMPETFESRWISYKKNGLISSTGKKAPSFNLGVAPISGGGMAVAALRF